MTPQEHMAWAQAHLGRTFPRWDGHRWEVECPACHDVLYNARGAAPLMQSLERHLLSDPPFALEHQERKIGDKLEIGGEWYEVAEIFRPYSNRYYHRVRLHTFQLALRRLRDGKFFRTSATTAGVVEPLARSQRREFGL